jgi:four helix bundle protein
MRRAAVSISSNIAEGSSRSSKQDYARFVEIATGSLFEVVSQATIGRNQKFLSEPEYKELYTAAEKQSRMLSGLRRSLA